jgi:excisionase family DNA binding protein
MPSVLTYEEAAEDLHMSVDWVRKLAAKKEVSVFKLGHSSARISKSSWEAYKLRRLQKGKKD